MAGLDEAGIGTSTSGGEKQMINVEGWTGIITETLLLTMNILALTFGLWGILCIHFLIEMIRRKSWR